MALVIVASNSWPAAAEAVVVDSAEDVLPPLQLQLVLTPLLALALEAWELQSDSDVKLVKVLRVIWPPINDAQPELPRQSYMTVQETCANAGWGRSVARSISHMPAGPKRITFSMLPTLTMDLAPV